MKTAAHRRPSAQLINSLTTEPILGEAPAPDNRKIVATLTARAALLGIVLSLIESDRGQPLFIASQGARTRDMHSTDEVGQFLARPGGAPTA